MLVRCERCGTTFEAEPQEHPAPARQARNYDPVNGDRSITCRVCLRRYFYYNGGEATEGQEQHNGHWYSDRRLTIVCQTPSTGS